MYHDLLKLHHKNNKGKRAVLLLCIIFYIIFSRLAIIEITRLLIDSAVNKNVSAIINNFIYLIVSSGLIAFIRIWRDKSPFRLYVELICRLENACILSIDREDLSNKADLGKRISVIRSTVERLCALKYDLFNSYSECTCILMIISIYISILDYRVLIGCYTISILALLLSICIYHNNCFVFYLSAVEK
jgi:hypothetical protein